jgi:hypothetical protein
MLRRSSVILAALVGIASRAAAQPGVVGEYLRQRGLEDLYAEYLLDDLSRQSGAERATSAQVLAEIYVRLMDESPDAAERQRWADQARTLLRVVPEADSPALQINLAKSIYLRAEEAAERHALRLASEREIAEAERSLRDILPVFLEIAQEANRESERLDAELSRDLAREDEDRVTAALTEARRRRSLAFYFAGWSSYYMAVLTGDASRAEQGLRHFGWLLGASDGAPATLDRLQPGLLRFEHVARSAVGAGLCSAVTGRILEANGWLDAVGRSTDVDAAVVAQLPARRAVVFAHGQMWPDLDTLARRGLTPASGEGDPMFARLVAVLALEELTRNGAGRHAELLRRLSSEAFATLVAAGQIQQLVDLVQRYGPDLLGSGGFVPLYVRGLVELEEARRAAGEVVGVPSDPVIQLRFLQAAATLTEAVAAAGEGEYQAERARALYEAGSALYQGGRPEDAASLLERVWTLTDDAELRERSLWLAVVALDQAVEGGRSDLGERRDRAATLFFSSYPASEQAAMLAMRPSTARLLSEGEAIEILLGTPSSAPAHADARRRAAALLYRAYRAAEPIDRDPIAERFMAVCEEVIAEDSRRLRELGSAEARTLAESIVVAARRLADAALGVVPPRIDRARTALDAVDRTAAFAGLDLGEARAEIVFRRLQIASAEGGSAAADRLLEELTELGGVHATTARRLLYRDAARAWIDSPADIAAARRVVSHGTDVAIELGEGPQQLGARVGVLETVARAADTVWKAESDPAMLRAALDARTQMLDLGAGDAATLRPHAHNLAAASRSEEAVVVWRRLLQSLAPGSDGWFEARYESLKLLATLDPSAAAIAAEQFRALHPDLGPPEWRQRFATLLEGVRPAGETPPP